MAGRGARQRRTANRRLLRKPPVIKSTPKPKQKYVEIIGSPYGFIASCLVVGLVLALAITIK